MSELFKVFVSLSISASLFILLLLWCRPLFKRIFSRRWQYYIWLVIILRLLIPFTPRISPVGELFRQPPAPVFQAEPGSISGEVAGDVETVSIPPDTGPALEDSPAQEPGPLAAAFILLQKLEGILQENLGLVWLGGVLILLARRMTAYQGFVSYIKAGCTEIADLSLLDRLAQLEERLQIRRPLVELYENPMAASPLLLGFFRPRIVLPSAGLPEDDFRYTVLHELIHYRRWDMLYKWLVQLCICLHWFNPLVWWMGREINSACELSCDEAVIRMLDARERMAYGDTLMHALEAGGPCKNTPASVTLSENAQLLKERLDAIMKFKKRSPLVGAFSLLLAAALTISTAAVGAYAGPAGQEDIPAIMGQDDPAAFRYTQQSYYQPPYLFEIGWNLQEKAAQSYMSRSFTVWDKAAQKNETLTAYFTSECAQTRDDSAAMQALYVQLVSLYFETRELPFPAVRFLVVSVQNIGDTDTGILAERYYEDGSLSQFGAVFAQLNETAQEDWLSRIYEDRSVSFFSASLFGLKTGSPLIERLAERAYTDGSISFFSVLTGHMTQQALEGWLDRAAQDGRTSFRAVLLGLLGREQELTGWKKEMEEQLLKEYEDHGISKRDSGYFYQNQLVRIFLDIRENSSFQTLDVNPQGTVDIKIIRGEDGGIQHVVYMTEQEAEELLTDGDWDDWSGWAPDNWDGWSNWDPDDEEEPVQPARALEAAVPPIDTLEFRGKTYYLIKDEAQLRALASGAYGLDKDYMQQADIQLSEEEWTPIGTREQPFTGSFNGNGFEISHLTMTDPDAELIGLFGAARDAHIYNVTLRAYDIESAGREAGSRTLAPVMALNLGGARCEDNLVYPKQAQKDIQEVQPAGGDTLTIPVDAARMESGETLWLGEYLLSHGDRIQYDVSAKAGSCLQIAFTRPGEDPQNKLYLSVRNRRQDGQLRCTSDFTVSSLVPPGRYRLFLRAPEGELGEVKGSIQLALQEKTQDFQQEGVVRLTAEERPEPLQQAMESCTIRTWYVIRSGGRQYIWYNGFAWDFAYHPVRQGDGWKVDIVRMKKKDDGYLLLSLPADQELQLTLDGEPVPYTVL